MENIPRKYLGIVERAKEGHRKDAIQAHCLRCLDWKREEVRSCTDRNCFLWILRPYQPPHRISGKPQKQAFLKRQRKKYPASISKVIEIKNPTQGPLRIRVEIEPENR